MGRANKEGVEARGWPKNVNKVVGGKIFCIPLLVMYVRKNISWLGIGGKIFLG